MNTLNKLTSLSLSIFLLLNSCGQKKPLAEDQQIDYIRPPTYPIEKDSDLQLYGNKKRDKISYQGAAIFWRNDIKKADLARVLSEKEKTNELDLSYKEEASKVDDLQNQLVLTEERIQREKDKIDAELDLDDFYESQEESLQSSIQEIVKKYIDGDDQDFGYFCQAALWAFGASPLFNENLFKKRPIPLGLCESYFKKHEYFKGEECQTNSRENDFFKCIWGQSGVGKTEVVFYNDSMERVSIEEAHKIKASLSSDLWKNSYKPSDFFVLNLMVDGVEKEYYLDFNDAEFFEGSKLVKDVFDNVDFAGSDENLKSTIKILLKERKTAGKVISSRKYSFNDRLFNLHQLANSQKKYDMKGSDFAELLKTTDDKPLMFGAVEKLKEKEVREKNLEQLMKSRDIIFEVKKKYENELEGQLGYQRFLALDAWTKQKFSSAKYISDHNMAVALWPYVELRIQDIEQNLVQLTLQLDTTRNTKRAIACFNKQSLKEEFCPATEKTYVSMKVSVNKNTGVISLKIDAPESKNFYQDPKAYVYREDGSLDNLFFQEADLSKDHLSKLSLRFELLMGSYKSRLAILSGKAFLYQKDTKLYEASVSLSKAALSS